MITIDDIQTLSDKGGGHGYFGHRIRSHDAWNGAAGVTTVDLGLMDAANALDFSRDDLFLYGDSSYARHDADRLIDMLIGALIVLRDKKTGVLSLKNLEAGPIARMVASRFFSVRMAEVLPALKKELSA